MGGVRNPVLRLHPSLEFVKIYKLCPHVPPRPRPVSHQVSTEGNMGCFYCCGGRASQGSQPCSLQSNHRLFVDTLAGCFVRGIALRLPAKPSHGKRERERECVCVCVFIVLVLVIILIIVLVLVLVHNDTITQ